MIGLATEFRSEKIPRNRLGTVSVIPQMKVLILRHSDVHGRIISEAERNGIIGKQLVLRSSQNNLFSSTKCFGTKFASIFVPWNGTLSCFLFRGMIPDGILRVCFYFFHGTKF
jgi:hypothetical protein